MELYEAIFLIILSPFIIVAIGGFMAIIIHAYNIAKLFVQIARGKI